MRSILITLAVLFLPSTGIFVLLVASVHPGGTGAEVIGGATLALLAFIICASIVIVNYAFGHWW